MQYKKNLNTVSKTSEQYYMNLLFNDYIFASLRTTLLKTDVGWDYLLKQSVPTTKHFVNPVRFFTPRPTMENIDFTFLELKI